MNNSFQLEEIKRFVSLLSEHKINEEVILIGSWATYFYQSIWPKYQAIIRTTDIDFYTGFKIGSAQVDLPEILKKNNYMVDVKNGTYNNLIFNTRGFEIEFVTHLRRDQKTVFLVKSLNIKAVPLPHHEKITLDQTIVYQFGTKSIIRIIRPSLYVVLKLIINRNRPKEKGEKDLESIRSITPFLLNDKVELSFFIDTIKKLPSNQRRKCFKTIQRANLIELIQYFI
jgi:hypothetical protein